ncbi:Guanine nucleotide-binding protein-like 3-like protein [Tulasnella sp. 417]|nr:Guanine nucleotide-binding protein-like 3-like protein [Tulasnella sp. 417]
MARHKLRKDPGVPKLNLKQKQVNKIAERLRHEASRRAQGDGMTLDSSQSIAGLAAKASASTNALGDEDTGDADAYLTRAAALTTDPTLAAHAHQFKKVLESADVILQVLDARDPLGCRSKLVEEAVLRSGGDKKIILVLNKTGG